MAKKASSGKVGFIDNLKMRNKLFLLAGLMITLLIIVGGLSAYTFNRIRGITEHTSEVSTELLQHAADIDTNLQTMRVQIYRAISQGQAGNIEQRDKALATIDEAKAELKTHVAEYDRMIKENFTESDDEFQAAANLVAAADPYYVIFENTAKAVSAGDYQGALDNISANAAGVTAFVEGTAVAKNEAQEVLFHGLDDVNTRVTRNSVITLKMYPIE